MIHHGFEACSDCSDENVLSRVCFTITATHQGGERISQGRVDNCTTDLEFACEGCGALLWQTEINSPQPVDVSGWEQGNPCSDCGSSQIYEKVVEERVEDVDGTVTHSGEQVATLEYTCSCCSSTLKSISSIEILTDSTQKSTSSFEELSLDFFT